MGREPEISTDRLLLRRWQQSDLEPFAALNADPDVMEHFPSVMTKDKTEEMIARLEAGFDKDGFGLWALEHSASQAFMGFVGLATPGFEAHFTPAVEVGWRLAREYWGNGYAVEGARAIVRFGFEKIGLDEIVSFTIPANTRSMAVMKRLGMTHDPADDFDHPHLTDERMRRHVLYRLPRELWARLNR